MPYIPHGDYMFATGYAKGTQEDYVQHHWLHKELPFESQPTHALRGLIGLPIWEISLK